MNGYEAVKGSWPWAVSIGYFGPTASLKHGCGGTIINKRFILTATHCVDDDIYGSIGYPVTGSPNYASLANMMRVYVGISKRSTDINVDNTYRVEQIIKVSFFFSFFFKM